MQGMAPGQTLLKMAFLTVEFRAWRDPAFLVFAFLVGALARTEMFTGNCTSNFKTCEALNSNKWQHKEKKGEESKEGEEV